MGVEFTEYVAARRASLVRSAVLLGCDVHEAEDPVQTALTWCPRSWRKVQRADRPDAYVYRVLVNAFHDSRARLWRGELPTAELPDNPVEGADLATGIAVRRALLNMSREHREVLMLRYYADFSERETAAVLDLPAGTVKSRTARALHALAADQNIVRSN
jgi:RNA polymerase sigma-70 factor (sigma-E family)